MIRKVKQIFVQNMTIYRNTQQILYKYGKQQQQDNKKARQLTQKITLTKTNEQLKRIIKNNQSSFNLYNVSALLKKINTKQTSEEELMELAYQQVRQCLKIVKEPTQINTRAIANIIGYTGNRNYQGINQLIVRYDVNKLLTFANEKEFIMILTGLLKLGLIDQMFDNSLNSKNNSQPNLHKINNSGLIVSLWRNLIKHKKSTAQLNRKLAIKLTTLPLTHNLKDFGYLVYCYTESYQSLQSVQKMPKENENVLHTRLLQLIQNCSSNILYTNRVNMFQLCIFIDHLIVLKRLMQKRQQQKQTKDSQSQGKSQPQQAGEKKGKKLQIQTKSQYVQTLKFQYMRIIRQQINLRSLANGYLSMHKLHGEGIVNFDAEDDVEIYEGTVEKFMQIGTAILDKHTGASKVNQDSNTNGGTGNKSRFLKKDKQRQKQQASPQNLEDYQSVTSLLVQFITTLPNKYKQSNQKQLYLNNILATVLKFVLQPRHNHNNSCKNKIQASKRQEQLADLGIYKMSDREFQKFLYGLYLYTKQCEHKQNPSHRHQQQSLHSQSQLTASPVLDETSKQHIIRSLVDRNQLNVNHITSIIVFFNQFKLRDPRVCAHFKALLSRADSQSVLKQEQTKQGNISSSVKMHGRSCVMGLNKQLCLKCISKSVE